MKKTYFIEGMHCKACEIVLKKSCEKIAGCQIESVNHRTGTLTVEWGTEVDEEALHTCVAACGYSCHEKKPGGVTQQSNRGLAERLALIGVALVLTYVLIEVDVYTLLSSIQAGTSFGMIVLLGLVASVSTCLAVTGGVVIGFTELLDTSATWKGHALLHSSFHLGRIVGFFVFGAVLGLLGQSIRIGLGLASRLNVLIACVFVYLGLHMLGFVPSPSSWGIHFPEQRTKKVIGQRHLYLAPIVGAGTFFLPCGFTQSVQLMALASGNALTGGLMMSAFALGTLPGLLALGMGTSYAKDHRKQGLEHIVAIVLLVFGLFTFRGSASVRGWTDILQAKVVSQNVEETTVLANQHDDEVEIIRLSHNGFQVVPETTILKAGKTYEIEMTPESDGIGCMTTILLSRVDSTVHTVVKGETLRWRLENIAAGQYSFVCGSMGMRQGILHVE